MFKFFCSVCIDDKELYAHAVDSAYAYATCPDCGSLLKEAFSRHPNIQLDEMTTDSYNNLHHLDNNTP